jgi:metal-responsive CopG/Arc/MetJ family transcriptional regulator
MTKTAIYLPDDLYEDLRRTAFEEHTSMSEIVREALIEMLSQKRTQR